MCFSAKFQSYLLIIYSSIIIGHRYKIDYSKKRSIWDCTVVGNNFVYDLVLCRSYNQLFADNQATIFYTQKVWPTFANSQKLKIIIKNEQTQTWFSSFIHLSALIRKFWSIRWLVKMILRNIYIFWVMIIFLN